MINMNTNTQNLGLWYYKTFFEKFSEECNLFLNAEWEKGQKLIQKKHWTLCNLFLNAEWEKGPIDPLSGNAILKNPKATHNQKITTTYQGLVCGIGYDHEMNIPEIKDELKHGLSFDFTTGQPYIPGSSIKGVLRYAFRNNEFVIMAINTLLNKKELSKDKKDSLKKIIENIDWGLMEKDIFEGISYVNGENKSPYQSDVFFDAFISATYNKKILADDVSACHQDWTKPNKVIEDINMIRFLKVRSGVTFTVEFRLYDSIINEDIKLTRDLKKMLFIQILKTWGVGAKTNVGYGQFS